MDPHEPLELILQSAATDGIAYFVDEEGTRYFRPRDGQPIRPLNHDIDGHPMMYQFSREHPLAEKGRRFATPAQADRYVGILADLDMMFLLANVSENPALSEGTRHELTALVRSKQEGLKLDLAVLETIPGFAAVRKYLDMEPREIYAGLEARAQNL